jgi:creatinine amidohydrolase
MDKVKLAILPTGSNEGHGPHLPLKVRCGYVDSRECGSGTAIVPTGAGGADAGCRPLSSTPGVSRQHDPESRDVGSVLTDSCRSLMGYGIRRFAIANGHGNNMAVSAQAARRITEELEGVRVASFAYWEAIDSEKIAAINKGRHYPGHADEFETSMILHICPEHTRMDRLHEIEDRYGLHGDGPKVGPGEQFRCERDVRDS